MGFLDEIGSWLGSLVFGNRERVVDVRPPGAVEQANRLAAQYSRALEDPRYAMPELETQRLVERELIDDVYNRAVAGGGVGAGSSRAAAAKALADYRLGLLGQRRQALENLRATYMNLMGTPGQYVPSTPGIGQQVIESGAKQLGQGAISGIFDRIFGKDIPTKRAPQRKPQGTTDLQLRPQREGPDTGGFGVRRGT